MTSAEVAQRVRRELDKWGDVREVYGPSLGKQGQFFLAFVLTSGQRFAVELNEDGTDD